MFQTDLVKSLDLLATLRAQTAQAHSRLDHDLGLLREPPDRDRIGRLLERCYGFHAVWEPKVARVIGTEAAFLVPRHRAPRAAQDLMALGRTPCDIARLPLCLAAARLVSSPEAAIGSLYVLEGSTLTGQLVTRHLQGARGLPREGLGYFDPYGAATGTMWRHFRIWAEATSKFGSADAIVAGAVETFQTLQAWLIPAGPAA
jgi:heme oxygenase